MLVRIVLFYFILVSISCQHASSCRGVEDIYIPQVLQKAARSSGFPYCSILAQAIDRDRSALIKMIKFAYKTEDSNAIEHGIVFTELLLSLGDEYSYAFFLKEDKETKLLAAKMLDACITYRKPKLVIEKGIPKTFDLLLGKFYPKE